VKRPGDPAAFTNFDGACLTQQVNWTASLSFSGVSVGGVICFVLGGGACVCEIPEPVFGTADFTTLTSLASLPC